MNITPIGGSPPQTPAMATQPTADQVAQTREVAKAVQKLNSSGVLPDNREMSILIDPRTKLPVVRVLDTNTHEVLEQMPAESVLRITAFLESEEAQESMSKIPSLSR